jgi:hypothetical protein
MKEGVRTKEGRLTFDMELKANSGETVKRASLSSSSSCLSPFLSFSSFSSLLLLSLLVSLLLTAFGSSYPIHFH